MQRFRSWLACLLCVCTLALPAWAAGSSLMLFKRVSLLQSVSAIALLQDRQGFVWIGTQSGGLMRFDGYHTVRYQPDAANPRSLPQARVYTLFEDRQGRIWAGTRAGLARYEPATNDFTRFLPGPGPNNRLEVRAIIGDGKDGLWLATWGGLQHFDPASGEFVQYTHADDDRASLATNDINALAMDDHGGLWVGTWPGGVDYLAAGAKTFQHFRAAPEGEQNSKANIVRALHFDKNKVLWMGTEAGIYTWQQGTDWDSRKMADAPPARVNYFYADTDDTLWAGTISAGLLRFERGSTVARTYGYRANDPYSVPGNNVRSIMRDAGGMLWLGTFTDGVAVANLNSHGFDRIVPYESSADGAQASFQVLSLEGDGKGHIWVGSNAGVLKLFDPESGNVLKSFSRDSLDARGMRVPRFNLVISLYRDQERLWAGTDTGLLRIDSAGDAVQFYHFGDEASDRINAVEKGRDGRLWLGTGSDVLCFDIASGKYVRYVHDKDIPDARAVAGATAILEDRSGRVWVGSESTGGGLDLLDSHTGRFRHFRKTPGQAGTLIDDHVTTLYEHQDGRIFVGTSGGLNEILTAADGSISFRSFPDAAGVADMRVLAIRADKNGYLWMATVGGLARLNLATGKAERFSGADSMNDSFTVGSVYEDEQGRIYFGGSSRSVTRLDPPAVNIASVAPRVAITDIRVFYNSLLDGYRADGIALDGPVSAPNSLTLDARHSIFSVEFAALHFTDPSRNRYRHRLDGFDENWVETDAEHRSATYSNLDPGTYTLRVLAANNRGLWSDQEVRLAIHILPPFWKTWWFRLLVTLAVLALLFLAYRLRVRRLRRQHDLLRARVAMRTRELEKSQRELEASNAKLAALSTTDGLTGINNRRAFDAALEREWGRAIREHESLSLIMLDVDHFKKYNDHYGHQAGDECLKAVAALVGTHGRRTTDLAARYGGEEFVLLLPHTDGVHAMGLAAELCAAMAAQKLPHAASPFGIVTISIGVACMQPKAATDMKELIARADQALYRAKEAGRNRVVQAP